MMVDDVMVKSPQGSSWWSLKLFDQDSAGKGASEPTTSSPPAPAVVAEPVVAAAAPELKEKKSEGYLAQGCRIWAAARVV